MANSVMHTYTKQTYASLTSLTNASIFILFRDEKKIHAQLYNSIALNLNIRTRVKCKNSATAKD